MCTKVSFSFNLALSSKKDSDLQPVKGGTVHDLDDDGDKNEDSQMGKASDTQVSLILCFRYIHLSVSALKQTFILSLRKEV